MTVLPGIGALSSRNVAQVIFTDSAVDTTDATTYTFTSRAIGSAAANRIVLAAIFVRGSPSGSFRTFSSVTIGGVTATAITGTDLVFTNANWGRFGLFYAAVPTGTTATVVVTMSGASSQRAAIVLFAGYGISTTVPAVTTVTNSLSMTLNVASAEGGTLIAMAANCDGPSSTVTWTGADTVFDQDIEAAGTYFSVAWKQDVDGGTKACSAVRTGTVNGTRGVAVVIPPA